MATTVSTEGGLDTLPQIHQVLTDKNLLPSQHLVDTGHMSADMLVKSQDIYQVDLVGPARKDQKWQAMAGEGYVAADFQEDWHNRQVTCLQGHTLNPGSLCQKTANLVCL